MFTIIAAIGKNNELGKNNQLIFHLKEDMQFFRAKTTGHKVVMGHKTWDSLPKKLPGRENIVVSRHDFEGPDLIVHDLKQFISENKDTDEEIFIIGGGTLYFAFLPFAKTLYLTEVDASDEKASTFFPEFDHKKYHTEIIKKGSENGLNYAFKKYVKK
ncbi:dihydrofolate reductase [Candidatus Saccharibacteria bacterium]|nr:dihydrofolate reductase [Candidatus Saccharibacteria bacterium]